MLVQHEPSLTYTVSPTTNNEFSLTEANTSLLTSPENLIDSTTNSITMQPSYQQISEMGLADDETILHKTAVLIIMSILICISLTISAGVLIFCKKKNSVFAYQKSEQASKDYGYEMEDINTDNESSDSLDNTETVRSQTYPSIKDINNTSNRVRYKFIPKSKTFSGLDSCGLSDINFSPALHSESIYSSSSPSLNFQSLTIKVDIEPCQKSQSSECLTDHSTYNDYSSTSMTQSCELLHSNSAERLKSSIPWDFESNSWESINELTKLNSGKTNGYEKSKSTRPNQSDFTYGPGPSGETIRYKKSNLGKTELSNSSDSSEENSALCQPLLSKMV